MNTDEHNFGTTDSTIPTIRIKTVTNETIHEVRIPRGSEVVLPRIGEAVGFRASKQSSYRVLDVLHELDTSCILILVEPRFVQEPELEPKPIRATEEDGA